MVICANRDQSGILSSFFYNAEFKPLIHFLYTHYSNCPYMIGLEDDTFTMTIDDLILIYRDTHSIHE